MKKSGIPFTIAGIEPADSTIKTIIYKPHGSISFSHTTKNERSAFAISYERELVDGDISDFEVKYDNLDDNYVVTPLIPPAGESTRLNHTWAGKIRQAARDRAKALSAGDEIILCGLSYWHVDRAELDELFISCSPQANIKMINPSSPRSLNAVVASLFNNFIAYPSSDILKDIIR